MNRPLAALALALSLGACSTVAPTSPTLPPPSAQFSPSMANVAGVPADMLNPAVTEGTIHQTICVAGYSKSIRPPLSYTRALKPRLMRAYGLAPSTPVEIDHVVSIEDGGSPVAHANLFPELLAQAKEDDKVENRVHDYVCTGRLSLTDGQAQLLALKTAHGYDRAKSGVT